MDWTGGTRRRFAGAKNNNEALQRQKAHFARARAAVQHEPFSSHQRAKAIDHNDDTRARSYKGSGRDTVISGREERTKTSIPHPGATNFAGDSRPHHDEELHLLASRRKLLARNDWLALDHTRPLRLGFPTAVDKDRVGRRRKIKKSSETRTKAARPRLMTPLFEERLEPNAYHMSGTLSPERRDHIAVKVGTSAFGNHGRPSGRSNTSRNASIGAQSAALSHLSEESMLLGADGDSFDAGQVEVPAYTRDFYSTLEGMTRPASFDHRQYELEEVDPYSSCTREHRLASDDKPELQHYRAEILDEDSPSISSSPRGTKPTIGFQEVDNYAASGFQTQNVGGPQQANEFENRATNVLVDPSGVAIPADENSPSPEFVAEQEWRHLMGIVTQSESFTSRKALDSSSEHITTSESIPMTRVGDVQHGVNAKDDTTGRQKCGNSLNQAQPTQAPNLLMVDTQPPPPRLPEDAEGNLGDTDEEALWREFIIGSQGSESRDELYSAWQRSRERMRQSSEQPQSVQVSGLGTSDQATRGETTVCSPTVCAGQVTDPDEFLEHDIESIEESSLDSILRSSSPRNIHATLARKLDPRRFKMPRDSEGNIERKESQQHVVSRRYRSHSFEANQGRG